MKIIEKLWDREPWITHNDKHVGKYRKRIYYGISRI